MKGIIIVVWEKYLADQFGSAFIDTYRKQIGESPEQLPVSGKVYPDALLVKGVDSLATKVRAPGNRSSRPA